MELFTLGLLRPKQTSAGAEASAQQAQRSAEHLETELHRLQERFDKLSVLTAGMWALLQEKTGITDEELQQTISRIEAQRQQESQQLTCPQCGRAMHARDRRCLYCDFRSRDASPLTPVK